MNGIVGTYALPPHEWARLQEMYGVRGVRAPVVQVAARGFSSFSFAAPSFQHRASSGKGGRAAASRTGRGAAEAASIATSIRACPGVTIDAVDLQVVNLLSLGSSRAVIASLVGIGQGTVKRRILAMLAQVIPPPSS